MTEEATTGRISGEEPGGGGRREENPRLVGIVLALRHSVMCKKRGESEKRAE